MLRYPFYRSPKASLQTDNAGAEGSVLPKPGLTVAHALLTALLYTAPVLMVMRSAVVGDPDVWWHLRTGEWIVLHQTVPRTDPFAASGAGHPWAAYSWLFELLLLGLYRYFGLYGIVMYTCALVLAITVALHRLTEGSLGKTPAAILLTFVACCSMGHLFTPRPWLLTVLFFTIEVDALLRFRQTRKLAVIALLPFLFVAWANIHIQFIDGLVVLVLACFDELHSFTRQRRSHWCSQGALFAVTALCFLATLANPYTYGLYWTAHSLAAQPGVMNTIQELQAIPFRDPVDWCALALGAASVAALARRQCPSLFEGLLLLFGMALAFRSQRDVWVLAVAAAAILSSSWSLSPRLKPTNLPGQRYTAIAVALCLLLQFGPLVGMSADRLSQHLQAVLPVQASDFVTRANYPGPIFNDYAWGGYLMWSLKMSVCIDGRSALQGDEKIARSIATWGGKAAWKQDSDLVMANLVIGGHDSPLIQLLREDHEFRLVYEDSLATVFIRNQPVSNR